MKQLTKYGDIVISESIPNNFHDTYDKTKSYIIRIPDILKDFYDFQLETVHGSYFIYLNETARNTCPRIVNGTIYNSVVVLIIYHNNDVYTCLVKDRHKNYISLPGGGMQLNETPMKCAIRETNEETGLTINDPILFAEIKFQTRIFFCNINGLTKVFYALIHLNSLEDLISYSTDEIEYTIVQKIEHIDDINETDAVCNHPITKRSIYLIKVLSKHILNMSFETQFDSSVKFIFP